MARTTWTGTVARLRQPPVTGRGLRVLGGGVLGVARRLARPLAHRLGALAALLLRVRIPPVGADRKQDADRESHRDHSQARHRPDLHQVLDQQLHAHQAEHDRDRLVEVAEALDQALHQHEQRPQAQQGEDVAHPDDQRLARDRESGGDRVDREGQVGEHDRGEAQEQGRRVAPPLLLDEPVAPVELARHGVDAPHQAHHQVLVRIDVLRHPAPDPVGEHDQPGAEQIDDDVEPLDQLDARQDEDAAHRERGDDPPEQQPRPALVRHAEVREQEQEDEQVVERERALDEVDGRVGDRVLGPLEQEHRDRRQQRQHEPPDRPDDRLAEAGLAPAREEVQVEGKEHEQGNQQP